MPRIRFSATLLAALLTATMASTATPAAAIAQEQTGGNRETDAPNREKKPVNLKVGDKAPKFQAKTDQNKLWKSKDHVGKKILIVYFYPADFTGGCTAQACNYRDALKELDRKDVEVIGVSGDSVENHKHFKNEYELNFTLLADPDGKVAKAFGVRFGDGGKFEKAIDGQPVAIERGVTINRWTFVIGPEKTILHKDMKVNAAKDTQKVLKLIAKIPQIKQPKGAKVPEGSKTP